MEKSIIKAMKIKVCGMRHGTNIAEVARMKPDMMGFIFHPQSPRYAEGILEREVLDSLPPEIIKTGVFVNFSPESIVEITRKYGLEWVQLHGDEPATHCQLLKGKGLGVIKVFSPDPGFDYARLDSYRANCDYFLFDTPTIHFGGSGRKFDWEKLDGHRIGHPFILSGGIGPEDAKEIAGLQIPNLKGVDLNSRFELEPGIKDPGKLKIFMEQVKNK